MIAKGRKAFKSWMFIYAGFVAAAAFASPVDSVAQYDMADWSPVVIDTAGPAFKIEALSNRSDI